MDKINYIDYKGKTILYINFSKCHPRDIQPIIEEAKKVAAHQSPGTVLTLTNVADMMFDKKTNDKMKDLATHNHLFTKAEAVIGATGVLKVIFDAIVLSGKGKVKLFDDMLSAKEWLAGQK